MADAVREVTVRVTMDGAVMERLNKAASLYGSFTPGSAEKAEAATELWYAANAAVLTAKAEQVRADVEADLERRLGIALHQRDVWRDAHNALAKEVGPHGQAAQQQIDHWRMRYDDLSQIVGAMHGGEL